MNTLPVLLISIFLVSCTQNPAKPYNNTRLPSSTTQQRNLIISSAFNTIGSPYRYGGTSYDGFDCSGLTRHAYKAAGISIPRTAAQQRDQSTRISSYSRILPGDLIFFKTGRKTDHVGIFVGNGQFIHASTGKKRVVQSKLDTPYWRRSFVKFGTYVR